MGRFQYVTPSNAALGLGASTPGHSRPRLQEHPLEADVARLRPRLITGRMGGKRNFGYSRLIKNAGCAFREYDPSLARRSFMSARKIVGHAALFLATTFAHAEWKEFTFPDEELRVAFPSSPQLLMGAQRNLHQFSAIAGTESYGVAYADYSPGTDWKSAVDCKRDSIVTRLGASVVDEKRTSLGGNPGKWIRFRTQYER